MSTEPNFFLVLVDESDELHQALYFACKRAKSSGNRVALLYVIAPTEFAHWAGVGELMRTEAREFAEEQMRTHAEYVAELTGQPPLFFIREGTTADEVIALIDEEQNVNQLVLGADTKSETAGPVISYLTGKGIARCRVPVVMVPGHLTDEQIDKLI